MIKVRFSFSCSSSSVRTQTQLYRALSWQPDAETCVSHPLLSAYTCSCRHSGYPKSGCAERHKVKGASRYPEWWWLTLEGLQFSCSATLRYHSEQEEGLLELCTSDMWSNHTARLWISCVLEYGEKETLLRHFSLTSHGERDGFILFFFSMFPP